MLLAHAGVVVLVAAGFLLVSIAKENRLEYFEVLDFGWADTRVRELPNFGIWPFYSRKSKQKRSGISILPASILHEVSAGEDGLYLFAKFMPVLC